MTQPPMAQPAQETPGVMSLAEVYNYWLGKLAQAKEYGAIRDVKREIAKRVAEEFDLAWNALQDASGYRKAEPLERLIRYRDKPMTQEEALAPHQELMAQNALAEEIAMQEGKEPLTQPIPEVWSWEEQRLKLPREFEEDWADFQALRLRARNGDFGPEQQAEEIAWSAQAEIGEEDATQEGF